MPAPQNPPRKTAPLLSLTNVSLSYGAAPVIKSATFSLAPGDFACIVGPNGSGKSTLIKGILGLIKLSSGRVAFAPGLSPTAIGYLPQETRIDTNFPATVREIVLSGALGRMKHRPFYGPAERSAARAALKTLKISPLANESFSALSGGQKQKVLLARSLVATSKLLILDEPSNSLDYPSRREFYRLLKRLNKNDRLTIIMITHDLDAEDLIGNKVIAIKDGRTTLSDTKTYLRSFVK